MAAEAVFSELNSGVLETFREAFCTVTRDEDRCQLEFRVKGKGTHAQVEAVILLAL